LPHRHTLGEPGQLAIGERLEQLNLLEQPDAILDISVIVIQLRCLAAPIIDLGM
jgi:hypothetical protein